MNSESSVSWHPDLDTGPPDQRWHIKLPHRLRATVALLSIALVGLPPVRMAIGW